jgi:hypothetical protein
MAFSLYEIDGYQDISKPSDLLGENEYLQDVFYQTRPEVFNYNDNSNQNNDSERNPFFLERDRDEDEKANYFYDEFYKSFSPTDLQREEYLVKKSEDDKLKSIIAKYRLENNPIESTLQFTSINNKKAFTLNRIVEMTDDFALRYVPGVNVKVYKSERKDMIFYFKAKGFESWSATEYHDVIVEFQKNKKVTDIKALDVKLSCSCPFWQYYGPNDNAIAEDYLYGESKYKKYKRKNPDIKTKPRDNSFLKKNRICKHIAAVNQTISNWVIKNNLDTYREVNKIIKNFQDAVKILSYDDVVLAIEEVLKSFKSSDQKIMAKFIKFFRSEKSDRKKDLSFFRILKQFEEILDYQDKKLLLKVINDQRNIFILINRKKEDELKKKEKEEKIKEKERKQINEDKNLKLPKKLKPFIKKRKDLIKNKNKNENEKVEPEEDIKIDNSPELLKVKEMVEDKSIPKNKRKELLLNNKKIPKRLKQKLVQIINKKSSLDINLINIVNAYLNETGDIYG